MKGLHSRSLHLSRPLSSAPLHRTASPALCGSDARRALEASDPRAHKSCSASPSPFSRTPCSMFSLTSPPQATRMLVEFMCQRSTYRTKVESYEWVSGRRVLQTRKQYSVIFTERLITVRAPVEHLFFTYRTSLREIHPPHRDWDHTLFLFRSEPPGGQKIQVPLHVTAPHPSLQLLPHDSHMKRPPGLG